jgi:uncharacterized LabA/DUF88 family protein
MDRFGIFVDAGYVYAAGGLLCHGIKRRTDLDLNFASFTGALVQLGRELSGAQHLRTYWYDGAAHGVPTFSHVAVSRLSGVKLRLGQVSGAGQQKGVDSLVVRDLMKLSSEHAIQWALLVSGDEDLRQGMIEAQDCGVRVALVGIEPCSGNQSESLLREADDHIALSKDFLAPHFNLSLAGQPNPAAELNPLAAAPDPFVVGQRVAEDWIRRSIPSDVVALGTARRRNPFERVPGDTDRELLARGRMTYGDVVSDGDRKRMREGFWTVIIEYELPALEQPGNLNDPT